MTAVTRINKGLDVPIAGEPEMVISDGATVKHVALLGDDYVGMKPTMAVAEGDRVKLGQVVFEDKKNPGVQFTAPAAGKVVAVNRGAKRKFQSLVIEIDGNEEESFPTFPDHNLARLERNKVRDQLVASGLWTALRTRPYSKSPQVDEIPHSIFITAIDTNPLACDPAVVLDKWPAEFIAGVEAISALTDGSTYVCRRAGSEIPGEDKVAAQYHAFDGPHPAGLAGTHIHLLDPVDRNKVVWHIGYQDVVAVGHLFLTGKIFTERVVAIGGPAAKEPRLLRTRLGASLTELTAGEAAWPPGQEPNEQQLRVVSGSVLSGHRAVAPVDFLGRFDIQISLLAEGTEREFVGWLKPGAENFSLRRIFSSAWVGGDGQRFKFTTSTAGSPRAMVPIGMYEEVMPLDVIATPLLKSLITHDAESAQQLGALELAEEDLALCTFVCPGKYDYGPLLRENLTFIESEG